MKQLEARKLIAAGGTTFADLRARMANEYDGVPSATIRDFTRDEAHLLLRGCINGKAGTVDPATWEALAAQLILREFG